MRLFSNVLGFASAPAGTGAKILMATVLFSVVALTGCKPTEDNYRSAYSKAYEASRRKATEIQSSESGATLESMDGPRTEVVDGETLRIAGSTLKVFEGYAAPACTYGLAVARFSMPTNARGSVSDLSGDWPRALVAIDGADGYYVIAELFDSLQDAAAGIRKFRDARPDFPYIGLEGKPLVVVFGR